MSKIKSTSDQDKDQNDLESSQDTSERFEGTVRWFSEKRGYGFIEVNGQEVFIHRSALVFFGIQMLHNDDIVTVSLMNSERGAVVDKLYGVKRRPIPSEMIGDHPEDGEVIAKVKFFNASKGYGFIISENESKDIFIHYRILEKSGLAFVEKGQLLLVRLEDGEKGKQVSSIRIYNGEAPAPLLSYDDDG